MVEYLNFCDFRLRPNIQCNAVCTDGYEVTNLITDPEKGFLAYPTIKPPVHIDITFECNVHIDHILIWPSVGSQKSSSFILSTKINKDHKQYTHIANMSLQPSDKGILFYSRGTKLNIISTPSDFVKCIMRGNPSYHPLSIMSARVLRITIIKTEKSVPALRKVQVWGKVSSFCESNVIKKIHSLLNPLPSHDTSPASEDVTEEQQRIQARFPIKKTEELQNEESENKEFETQVLEVPEDFLDSITWEIMTQPVLLPSGKTIDQSTLEKFVKIENGFGRPASDPFTFVPFDTVKPILLSALKSRIDKFLLENSDKDEIKKMPRVLGESDTLTMARNRLQVPIFLRNNKSIKRTSEHVTLDACRPKIDNNNNDSQQTKRFCHRLPAIVTRQSLSRQSNFNVTIRSHTKSLPVDYSDNLLDDSMKEFLSNKEIVDPVSKNCKCCEHCILYRLPCKHTICRKQLLSSVYKQCTFCGLSYQSSEVERVHIYM